MAVALPAEVFLRLPGSLVLGLEGDGVAMPDIVIEGVCPRWPLALRFDGPHLVEDGLLLVVRQQRHGVFSSVFNGLLHFLTRDARLPTLNAVLNTATNACCRGRVQGVKWMGHTAVSVL